MNRLLSLMLLLGAVTALAQTASRRDLPDVENDFWNTSTRNSSPVCVDEGTTAVSLTELDTRTETHSASAAVDDLDSRFMTQCVSNGTDIRGATPLLIQIR